MSGSEHHACSKAAEALLTTPPGHAVLAGTAGVLTAVGVAPALAVGAATVAATCGLGWCIGQAVKWMKEY